MRKSFLGGIFSLVFAVVALLVFFYLVTVYVVDDRALDLVSTPGLPRFLATQILAVEFRLTLRLLDNPKACVEACWNKVG